MKIRRLVTYDVHTYSGPFHIRGAYPLRERARERESTIYVCLVLGTCIVLYVYIYIHTYLPGGGEAFFFNNLPLLCSVEGGDKKYKTLILSVSLSSTVDYIRSDSTSIKQLHTTKTQQNKRSFKKFFCRLSCYW